MRKTDISNYSEEKVSGPSVSAGEAVGSFFASIWRVIATILLILFITGFVVGISLIFYIISIASEPLDVNLNNIKMKPDKMKKRLYFLISKNTLFPTAKKLRFSF